MKERSPQATLSNYMDTQATTLTLKLPHTLSYVYYACYAYYAYFMLVMLIMLIMLTDSRNYYK